jgi:hypothetical protein
MLTKGAGALPYPGNILACIWENVTFATDPSFVKRGLYPHKAVQRQTLITDLA